MKTENRLNGHTILKTEIKKCEKNKKILYIMKKNW